MIKKLREDDSPRGSAVPCGIQIGVIRAGIFSDPALLDGHALPSASKRRHGSNAVYYIHFSVMRTHYFACQKNVLPTRT